MQSGAQKPISVFGCPLDCDEKYDAIQEKRNPGLLSGHSDDPFEHVTSILRRDVPQTLIDDLGSIAVPDWLRPVPPSTSALELTAENFVAYMDGGGCHEMARSVKELVAEKILPGRPCMIGVDHALTGGAFEALSDAHGPDQISLIVVDSHTDAIPMSALSSAIQYDIDTNSNSVHDPDDPLLYGRPDSYNASSFIHHLLDEGILLPQNLYLVGVSDFPDKRATKIKDPRFVQYVKAFTDLRRRKVKIVTKQGLKTGSAKLKNLLKGIKTPRAYVSIDMDIGALNALEGVRFLNWKGLAEAQIYKIADAIAGVLRGHVSLAGLDVMEFNTRTAGKATPSGPDPTYQIAATLIKKIAFNIQ